MIIQGSNNPLVIQFDASLDEITTLVISLWRDRLRGDAGSGELIKQWRTGDAGLVIDNDEAICDFTEEETAALPPERIVLEAKGLDVAGNTIFWDAYPMDIKARRDKTIALTRTEG